MNVDSFEKCIFLSPSWPNMAFSTSENEAFQNGSIKKCCTHILTQTTAMGRILFIYLPLYFVCIKKIHIYCISNRTFLYNVNITNYDTQQGYSVVYVEIMAPSLIVCYADPTLEDN